jgi:hypothetical protein
VVGTVILLATQVIGKVLGCAVLALGFAWIGRFRIVIDEPTLFYTSLFGGTRAVELSHIASTRTEFGSKGYPFGPVMRLVVTIAPPSEEPQIAINTKVFSRRDLRKLFDILAHKMEEPPFMSLFGRE